MNVPRPNVQFYVLDTSKPPPLPPSSVSVLSVVGTSSPAPAAGIIPPPAPTQSANYGLPITLPETTTYTGTYASGANIYTFTTDYSLPPPNVVVQQQPDFTQFFSIPPPPLPNVLLTTSQSQLQQHIFLDDNNASSSVKRSGLTNRNHYKDVQDRINRYRRLGERSRIPLDGLARPRKSKRRKNAAYHQEIFEQFQRNFEKFNHDENESNDSRSKKIKCDEESRIPACYRLQKATSIKNDSRCIEPSGSSEETSLSDGEVKSDNFTDSSSDEESSAEKRLKKHSTSNHNDKKSNNHNFEDFSSFYGDAIQSSVSETEEEDANYGEKQSDTAFVQSSNAKLYYVRDNKNFINSLSTDNLKLVQNLFENRVLNFCRSVRLAQPQMPPLPEPQPAIHKCHHHAGKVHHRHQNKKFHHKNSNERRKTSSSSSQSDSSTDSDSSCSSDASENENARFKSALEEIRRKEEHPARLHKDIWFNEKGQMNDGPLCRCSWKARRSGIAHSLYPGEKPIPLCEPDSNNIDRLHHYKLEITPLTNILTKNVTTIRFDDHDYVFSGYSIFTHRPLPDKLPECSVSRWNIDYKLTMVKEEPPENFTVKDLNLFWNYFFVELLELLDVNLLPSSSVEDAENLLKGNASSCPVFHVFPRFVRHLKDDWLSEMSQSAEYQPKRHLCNYGIEILSMQQVLKYLCENFEPVFDPSTVYDVVNWSVDDWNRLLMKVKGQLVVNPSMRPSAIRVDQIDRALLNDYSRSYVSCFPTLIHSGVRPSVLTYTGNPEYQRAWKHFVKFRHLLSMKSKLTSDDKMKLAQKEQNLLSLKAKTNMKRDVTVEISSEGFYRTGLCPDMVQHGLMMLVMFCHIRFHYSLEVFENDRIKYKFKNKALLELAFTHPSYLSNYGTNPDHARNVLSNCGVRQPEYGDIKLKQVFSRKRGINTLIDIMSRFGSDKVKQSLVQNNERLEYLGDAVVEFLSTIHLFFMFPDLEEGGLATYRSSIVQNKHLAVLGRKIGLEDHMLYAHGPDLCHEANLRHAIANAFEAVMGAVFLDGGIEVADRIFGNVLFKVDEEPDTNHVWFHLPKHALQQQEPDGDRHWVEQVEGLKNLENFERQTGITFRHIRLLAKAFTRKNVAYNNLTMGHNQRLEFLGDTVLQLVTSEYLYKHFPEHHEGHLSLLRSCLVKNKTQAVICDDLGITKYIIQPSVFSKSAVADLRMKDKADLVEAFLGALYVDRGLDFCKTFCRVCLYPRLKYFIMSQKWNDPKSQLQQCCLTVRNPDGGEPDIPVYKVISIEGPTNTRIYRVAVYFKSKRLAAGCGHSVQEAEMKAAEEALIRCSHLFPHLQKQRHFMKRKFQRSDNVSNNRNSARRFSSSHYYRRPDTKNDRQDYQQDGDVVDDQKDNQNKMLEKRSVLNTVRSNCHPYRRKMAGSGIVGRLGLVQKSKLGN